jgi:catechol 2,3-dioxygenase-like lactoylglutathione lyase family enzyme
MAPTTASASTAALPRPHRIEATLPGTTPRDGAGRAPGWQDPAMRIVRVDHVQLAMPAGGEEEAAAFYEGILGIPQVPKPPHLAARGGCWFERGDLKVHLGVEGDFRAATKAHPAFEVEDVRALAAAAAAAGHRVKDDEPLEGYDRVYVDDPFGNRIELMERLPGSAR